MLRRVRAWRTRSLRRLTRLWWGCLLSLLFRRSGRRTFLIMLLFMVPRGTRGGTFLAIRKGRCRSTRTFILLEILLVVRRWMRISPLMARPQVLFSRLLVQLFLPVFRPLRRLPSFGPCRRRRCRFFRFPLPFFLLLSVFPLRLVSRLLIGGSKLFLLMKRLTAKSRRRFLVGNRWRAIVPMRRMFVRKKASRELFLPFCRLILLFGLLIARPMLGRVRWVFHPLLVVDRLREDPFVLLTTLANMLSFLMKLLVRPSKRRTFRFALGGLPCHRISSLKFLIVLFNRFSWRLVGHSQETRFPFMI